MAKTKVLDLPTVVFDEDEAVERIVLRWLETSQVYRNETIEFAKNIMETMDEFPEASQANIWRRVKEDERVLDVGVSLSRVWDATRLLRARKDLLVWTPTELRGMPEITEQNWRDVATVTMEDGSERNRPHVKRDGDINWEFYMRLQRYKLTTSQRIELENQAKINGWSVRDLQENIRLRADAREANQSVQELAAYRQMKGEIIRNIQGLVSSCSVTQLESFLQILNAAKNVAPENLSGQVERIVEVIKRV